jgi:hypothetical protein
MSVLFTARIDKKTEQGLKKLGNLLRVNQSHLIREILEKGLVEKKLEYGKSLYRAGKVTLARAAEIAGVSRWEMIESYDGAWQYRAEDLVEDQKPL